TPAISAATRPPIRASTRLRRARSPDKGGHYLPAGAKRRGEMKGGLPHNFGQLESMHDSATGETTYYQYDLFGNLLRVDLPDGRAIEYDVDGAGRRVGRRELDADGFEISFRGWIYRDLLRPIAEVDRDGNVVARYVYGDAAGVLRNIDEGLYAKLGLGSGFKSIHGSGRLSPRYILELASDGTITRTLAPITDEFGNVYLVIDVLTGETVQRLEYDIFGQVLFDSLPGAFPFGYGGGLYDSVTGHTRFGARDVEHISGRWFARDPVRFKSGQMNLFLHGDADPLNALDATGLATYRCERPLGDYSNVDTPEDRRNFADVPGNPLYHEYVCVKQGNHTICNGQGPSGGGGGGYINSPGRPTNDQWSMYRCRRSHEDDLCLESCLGGK